MKSHASSAKTRQPSHLCLLRCTDQPRAPGASPPVALKQSEVRVSTTTRQAQHAIDSNYSGTANRESVYCCLAPTSGAIFLVKRVSSTCNAFRSRRHHERSIQTTPPNTESPSRTTSYRVRDITGLRHYHLLIAHGEHLGWITLCVGNMQGAQVAKA